ncbi:MAG: hypothetical protein IIT57_06700 [Treponema sp.]|jgi:hypothetical protein|nr:hypothetical protein [Treponema sp.]MBR4386305.1 hypothetical protein [Treponema sp.]
MNFDIMTAVPLSAVMITNSNRVNKVSTTVMASYLKEQILPSLTNMKLIRIRKRIVWFPDYDSELDKLFIDNFFGNEPVKNITEEKDNNNPPNKIMKGEFIIVDVDDFTINVRMVVELNYPNKEKTVIVLGQNCLIRINDDYYTISHEDYIKIKNTFFAIIENA